MTQITICTAIWCDRDPGRGAYAFRYEKQGEKPVRGAFGRRESTTNRLQLMALLGALHNIGQSHPGESFEIILESPSTHLTNGLETAEELGKPGQKDHDLWAWIAEATELHRIQANLVMTGGNIEMQHLQQLAQEAGSRQGLPPDVGYEEAERNRQG